jgi:hypothetical protein
MARHSVQLVRVLGVAVGLAKLRLCKIIVEDGRLLLLELTS